MKQAIGYIIVRDILLLLLIVGHLLFYYQWVASLNPSISWVLIAGACLWAIYYIKSVMSYWRMKNDPYLREAYHDEYFKDIMLKASHHGYISVFIVGIALIITSILTHVASITVDIPYYITGEIIMLFAIVTDDVSKIVQLGR